MRKTIGRILFLIVLTTTAIILVSSLSSMAWATEYDADYFSSTEYAFKPMWPLHGDARRIKALDHYSNGNIHGGIDFNARAGTPVYAVANGTVVAAGEVSSYGYRVIIEHEVGNEKYYSLYAHLTAGSISVKKGDTVDTNTQIGLSGNTGHSSGAHLHFEIQDETVYKMSDFDRKKELRGQTLKYYISNPSIMPGTYFSKHSGDYSSIYFSAWIKKYCVANVKSNYDHENDFHNDDYYCSKDSLAIYLTLDYNGGWNSKNGSPYNETIETKPGNSISLGNYIPQIEFKDFIGWSRDPDATTPEFNSTGTYTPTKSETLYAVYQGIPFTVVYHSNTNGLFFNIGETTDKIEYVFGTRGKLISNAITSKDKHVASWTTNRNGTGKKYEYGQFVDDINPAKGATIHLYAQWANGAENMDYLRKTYEIDYDPNGGSGSMEPSIMPIDDYEKLRPNTFTRTGYSFTGWSGSPNGSVKYTDQQYVYLANSNVCVTLYAQWQANGDSNDANPAISSIQQNMIVNVGKGYTLRFCSYVSTDNKYEIGSIPNGTEVFVYGTTEHQYDNRTWAKINYDGKDGWVNYEWLAEVESRVLEYSITFNPNGGTGTMPEAEMVCGVPKALPKNTFRKTGDTFVGWSGSRTGPVQYNDQQVVDLSKKGGICIELFAQWEPDIKTYTVQRQEFMSGNIVDDEDIAIATTNSTMKVNVGAGSTLRFCSYVSLDNAYEIGSIPNDTVVFVYGTTTEQYDGRTWAKINYNNTDGWVNVAWLAPYTEQTTTVSVTPTPAMAYEKPILSISENNAPAELTVGSNFGLRGIIQTNCGTITNVYAYLYDSGDNLVLSREYTPNETSHNLRYSVNNDFAFGKLDAGTYRYIVEAKAVNGDQTTATRLIDASFRINRAAAPAPTSQVEPQIQSVGNNMQVAVGSGSTLRFCSNVSLDNAYEIGSIPNDAIVYVYGTTTQQYENRTWAKINYNGTDGWVNVAWLVPYTVQSAPEPVESANPIDISEYVGQWTAGMYFSEHDIYDDMLTIEHVRGNEISVKWELYRIAGFTETVSIDPNTGIAQFQVNASWTGSGVCSLKLGNGTVSLTFESSSMPYVYAGDVHVYTEKRAVPSRQQEAVAYDPPVLSISGNNAPSDMTVGSNFGIRGVIQTNCGTITRVQAYILDSNYSPVQASEYAPNEASLDLRYTVNNDLVFGRLPAGSYVYYVEATAVNGDKTTNEALINLSFNVIAPAPVPQPEPPIQAIGNDMVVNVGKGSTLRFCSTVSVDDEYEIGSIPNAQTVYVYGVTTQKYENRTWARINYLGVDGWVNYDWLTNVPQAVITPEPQPEPTPETVTYTAPTPEPQPPVIYASNDYVSIDKHVANSSDVTVYCDGDLPSRWYLNLAAAGPFVCDWVNDRTFTIYPTGTGIADLEIWLVDEDTEQVVAKRVIQVEVVDSGASTQIDTPLGNTRNMPEESATQPTPIPQPDLPGYRLATKLDTNYVLDIAGHGVSNGDNLQISRNNNSSSQGFDLTDIGGGYWRITNSNSGLDLTAEGAGTSGSNVYQWEYTGSDTQIWYFVENPDGSYLIANKASGCYLDVNNAWANDGNNVGMFVRNDGYDAQNWFIQAAYLA